MKISFSKSNVFMHTFFLSILVALPLSLNLTACSSGAIPPAPTIGKAPAAVPPRMVKDAKGRVIWNNPEAFGPVPPAMQSFGNASCSSLEPSLVAIGYHPKAENLEGVPMQGGGFFCFYGAKK